MGLLVLKESFFFREASTSLPLAVQFLGSLWGVSQSPTWPGMEKVGAFMGTALDAVIPKACLLQECFQMLEDKAWEPANPTSAFIANTSPSDCPLSLGNCFRLSSTASASPQCHGMGTGTQKGCLTDKLSLWRCLSLPWILFFFFPYGICMFRRMGRSCHLLLGYVQANVRRVPQ